MATALSSTSTAARAHLAHLGVRQRQSVRFWQPTNVVFAWVRRSGWWNPHRRAIGRKTWASTTGMVDPRHVAAVFPPVPHEDLSFGHTHVLAFVARELEQFAQLVDAEPGLSEDRAQGASRELAVHGHDHCAAVGVAQLAVTASLAAEREAGALEGASNVIA